MDIALPVTVNQDEVQSRLFARWFEIFGSVQGLVDSEMKRGLQASMEELRLLIEGKDVISQENIIIRQLYQIARQIDVVRGQH